MMARLTRYALLVAVFLILISHHTAARQMAAQQRIEITKSDFTLKVFRGEVLEKTFRVAVGLNLGDKEKRGDKRTPVGRFRITDIHASSHWSHDFHDGKGTIKGAYGPWFLRLYTGKDVTASGKAWSGIGIHGTHAPESIGTRATEGCIRLSNTDIAELKSLVRIGTSVEIKE
jgi:lipoprotein-anchoring transpeptidase ErfK/SrfK